MRTAIRKHLPDFVAILVPDRDRRRGRGYILSNQRFYLPAWVPVLGQDFFEIKAEFPTAKAVTPGQGQTVTSPASTSARSRRSSSSTAARSSA